MEPGKILQMHQVKLGTHKGVRDPPGHAWVRTSIRGDVLHRQNAGYPVPPLPIEISVMLKIFITSTANLKVHFDDHPCCNTCGPDLMRDLTILGFMWIKATAPSPP